MIKWKKGKSTGPNSITHEILTLFMNHGQWSNRMVHMMNDFSTRGPAERGPQRSHGVVA